MTQKKGSAFSALVRVPFPSKLCSHFESGIPDLSIIVVNWNTRELLERCLHAAYATIRDLAFEVIVVDNGSADGSPEMVRQRFPQALCIENTQNLGFARANNQAIRQCRGRYVLLLNSDAFLTGQAVQHLLQCVEAHPEIGIAGAALFDRMGRRQVSHGRLPSLFSEMLSLSGLDKFLPSHHSGALARSWIETGWVSGACLLARRSLLDQVGLLDEGFFLFGEEVDLCYRARQAGWKAAHLPRARVVHVGGGSTGVTARRILLLYKGKLYYFKRHLGRPAAHRLLAAMRFATLCKRCVYCVLRGLSLGKVRKDRLWREVARGWRELQA